MTFYLRCQCLFFFTSPRRLVSSCLSQMMSLKPLIFQTAVSWLPTVVCEPRTRHNIPTGSWAVQQQISSLPWVQDSTSAYLCTYFFSQTYWTCRTKISSIIFMLHLCSYLLSLVLMKLAFRSKRYLHCSYKISTTSVSCTEVMLLMKKF